MMNIKRHIPNLITLLNLLCGCIAIVYASGTYPDGSLLSGGKMIGRSDFIMAFYFVCLGIFLDFFDGFFARMFKVSSPLGLQLDSLADMITSGIVPGFVMFSMLKNSTLSDSALVFLPYLGFIITLGSCYRLANFNIDERQSDSFIGLPTPANALFIMSLPIVLMQTESLILLELLINPYVLVLISILSAYLLNAEIPLFSLKVKDFSLRKNFLQIGFLLFSMVLLMLFQFAAVPLIILFYVALSVISNKLIRK